jgi:hypothetical protein
MSAKRPVIDLMALTSEQATPMPEAVQRTAPTVAAPLGNSPAEIPAPTKKVPSADLQPLAFKVPPEFRKRFRQRAANADLKLNELLFAAFDAWEEQQGLKVKKS